MPGNSCRTLSRQSACWPEQPTRVTWGGVVDCCSVLYEKQRVGTSGRRHPHGDSLLREIMRPRSQDDPERLPAGIVPVMASGACSIGRRSPAQFCEEQMRISSVLCLLMRIVPYVLDQYAPGYDKPCPPSESHVNQEFHPSTSNLDPMSRNRHVAKSAARAASGGWIYSYT